MAFPILGHSGTNNSFNLFIYKNKIKKASSPLMDPKDYIIYVVQFDNNRYMNDYGKDVRYVEEGRFYDTSSEACRWAAHHSNGRMWRIIKINTSDDKPAQSEIATKFTTPEEAKYWKEQYDLMWSPEAKREPEKEDKNKKSPNSSPDQEKKNSELFGLLDDFHKKLKEDDNKQKDSIDLFKNNEEPEELEDPADWWKK